MKNYPRVFLIAKLFVVTMAIFLSQKLLFMLYNRSVEASLTGSDYIQVMLHGIKLDLATTAYTLVVPVLLIAFSCLWRFRLRPWLAAYYFVLMAILALIFVADTVLYDFWHFKLDAQALLYTDKPTNIFASVSWLFIIGCAVTLVVSCAVYYLLIYICLPKKCLDTPKHRLQVLWALPLVALLFLLIRGTGTRPINVSQAYYSERQFLNHSATNTTFNLLYTMNHSKDFSRDFHYFDDAQRATLVKNMFPTESIVEDTLLRVERPNILLVVWEGCGASVAGCIGAKGDATPELDSLARKSVLFTRCKACGFRTDRGLVSINSGHLSLPTASLMKMQRGATLPGIARSLTKAGYKTDFWYGGDITFMNIQIYMYQNGFQHTYSDADFPHDTPTCKWGVHDGILFDKVLEELAQRDSDKPWFTEVLTLSSHESWKVPYNRLEKKIENAFAYTDSCLGAFVNGLQKLPLWDNLLLIVVADHGCTSRSDLSAESEEVVSIPLIFAGGAIRQAREIDILTNQSDIAATLLGQLGIAHDDFLFSRDVFSATYTAPSALHTSPTEITFYDLTGSTTLDLVSGRIISNKGDSAEQRVDKSKAVLQTLYEDAGRR